MLRGLFFDGFGQFLVAHRRQRDLFHDHGVSADRGCHGLGLDLIIEEQFGNRARNRARVDDHRVNDDVGR